MGKTIITFYDYMMHYPHQLPDRLALAAEMEQLARNHREVMEIDSLMDLMNVSRLLQGERSTEAASGSLWCEYCAASGHEMS